MHGSWDDDDAKWLVVVQSRDIHWLLSITARESFTCGTRGEETNISCVHRLNPTQGVRDSRAIIRSITRPDYREYGLQCLISSMKQLFLAILKMEIARRFGRLIPSGKTAL